MVVRPRYNSGFGASDRRGRQSSASMRRRCGPISPGQLTKANDQPGHQGPLREWFVLRRPRGRKRGSQSRRACGLRMGSSTGSLSRATSKVKGDQISRPQLDLEIARPVLAFALVQADVQRIMEIYRRFRERGNAKVTSRIIDLPNGRVDVVFTIDEGDKTGIKAIDLRRQQGVSARAQAARPHDHHRDPTILSFFKTSDVYDPDEDRGRRGI